MSTFSVPAFTLTGGHDYLTDALAHQAPSSAPQPVLGAVYVDPVFGGHIRRVTGTGRGGNSDNYSYNGCFNADGSKFIARPTSAPALINASTGAILIPSLPFGTATFNMQFDPVDPNVYYYWTGASLMSYNVSTGVTTTLHTFPSALQSLGGSLNYQDNSGQLFVVNFGGVTTVWDRAANVVYSGGSTHAVSTGWVAISPDGRYLIESYDSGGGATPWYHNSYAINRATHSLGLPVQFWNLSNGHEAIVSASDGKTYLIGFDRYGYSGGASGTYRIDVTLPQSTATFAQQAAQNKLLYKMTWADDGHQSAVTQGVDRDCCFIGMETSAANSGSEIYWNEILRVNVLTGEIRRYVHHLSAPSLGYYDQPRISASRDGKKVLFASSWGGSNYAFASPGLDLYALEVQ